MAVPGRDDKGVQLFPTGNLALGKSATALSTDGSKYTPDKAVDGSTSTYWRSDKVSSSTIMWWRVDLGASYAVNRVVIKWNSSYYAKKYEIQVSTDDTVYNPVYTDNSGNGGTDDVTFAAATGRYVRIYMTSNKKSSERISEVEVYGGVSAALSWAVNNETNAVMIPDEIARAQNYPNPFNPATKISYALPNAMQVSLKVCNIFGQEVATLVNGEIAAGVHHVQFEASHLTSGIYFAVLKAGEVTQVRRMIFMK